MKLLNRPSAVGDATEALSAAEDALREWIDAHDQKNRAADVAAAQVAELEARAGSAALDDPGAVDQLTNDLIRLRTAQEISGRAVDAARERVDAGRRDVLRARAGALRARSDQLRTIAAMRTSVTTRLLAELAGHEKVPYEPKIDLSDMGSSIQRRPLTALGLTRAGWLAGQADGLDRVADSAPADVVLSTLGMPLPEVVEVEQLILAAAGAE